MLELKSAKTPEELKRLYLAHIKSLEMSGQEFDRREIWINYIEILRGMK